MTVDLTVKLLKSGEHVVTCENVENEVKGLNHAEKSAEPAE